MTVTGKLPQFSFPKLEAIAGRLPCAVDAGWLHARSTVWPASWQAYFAANYKADVRVLVFTKFDSRSPRMIWTPDCAVWEMPAVDDGAWYLSNPVDGQWRQVARCVSPYNPEGWTCRTEECVTAFLTTWF